MHNSALKLNFNLFIMLGEIFLYLRKLREIKNITNQISGFMFRQK